MDIWKEITLIFTATNIQYLLKGLLLTFELAAGIIFFSLIFGTVFALLKTYGGKLAAAIVTVYTEVFRNTPGLLWICVCFVVMPFRNQIIRAASGLVLVSSAVICEIVRGGLNSVAKGQVEAGLSQGLNTFQIVYAIILPQCFRRIIPNLINQTISVFKDTSYVGQVAIAEFLYCTKKVMSTSNLYTGHGIVAQDSFIMFGMAAIVYLVINLMLSSLIRYVQAKMKFV